MFDRLKINDIKIKLIKIHLHAYFKILDFFYMNISQDDSQAFPSYET